MSSDNLMLQRTPTSYSIPLTYSPTQTAGTTSVPLHSVGHYTPHEYPIPG